MKCMLYALNGGRDEITGDAGRPAARADHGEVLDYDEVMARFDR
jgi:formate C-acetyltransferase